LLGIDDVHDDAALEHLGHAAFHARGSDVVRGFGLCSEIGHGRPQLFAGWMKLLPSYGGGLALPTRRSPLRGADVWRATRSRVAPTRRCHGAVRSDGRMPPVRPVASARRVGRRRARTPAATALVPPAGTLVQPDVAASPAYAPPDRCGNGG